MLPPMAVHLTRVASLRFLFGAQREGYVEFGTEPVDQTNNVFDEEYERILTCGLLYGGVALSLPDYAMEELDCPVLVREDVVQFVDSTPAVTLHSQLSKIYSAAYAHIRAAEADVRWASVASLEALLESS